MPFHAHPVRTMPKAVRAVCYFVAYSKKLVVFRFTENKETRNYFLKYTIKLRNGNKNLIWIRTFNLNQLLLYILITYWISSGPAGGYCPRWKSGRRVQEVQEGAHHWHAGDPKGRKLGHLQPLRRQLPERRGPRGVPLQSAYRGLGLESRQDHTFNAFQQCFVATNYHQSHGYYDYGRENRYNCPFALGKKFKLDFIASEPSYATSKSKNTSPGNGNKDGKAENGMKEPLLSVYVPTCDRLWISSVVSEAAQIRNQKSPLYKYIGNSKLSKWVISETPSLKMIGVSRNHKFQWSS